MDNHAKKYDVVAASGGNPAPRAAVTAKPVEAA